MNNNKKFSKYIIWVLLLIIVPIYFVFNPSNYNFFPQCPFYKFSGYYCPGCGSQRAFYDIFNGNFLNALEHNILMVVVVFCGIITYLLSKKAFFEIIYHPKTPYIFLAVTIVFWILRNLHFTPFNWLAP